MLQIVKHDVKINGPQSECWISSTQTLVQNYAREPKGNHPALITAVINNCIAVSAVAFNRLAKGRVTKGKAYTKVEVFAVSLADINKALALKVKTDLCMKLLKHFYEFLDLYSCTNTNKLLLLQGKGVNYRITLKKKDRKMPKVLQGPLYNMSCNELLVLHKTLIEYLSKGFIQVNNSLTTTLILFVQKLGDSLQFCIDY